MALIRQFVQGVKAMWSTDKKRVRTQADTVLGLLRRRPVFNYELAEIALQYNRVIYDLRKAGHTITRAYVSPGVYIYTLAGNPDTRSDQSEPGAVGALATV